MSAVSRVVARSRREPHAAASRRAGGPALGPLPHVRARAAAHMAVPHQLRQARVSRKPLRGSARHRRPDTQCVRPPSSRAAG